MKIECLREKFSDAIYKTEKITGKNLTLPVLKCILLDVKNNTLTIRATNLDLGIEISLPVKMMKPGLVAIPGAILNSFLQNLHNDKNIVLETDDNNNLHVSTSTNSTTIKSMLSEDFPTIPILSKDQKFTINTSDFIKGLRSVWYSSATSSMKPELSSVYMYNDNEHIVFAATDSFRLAEKKIRFKKGREFSQLLIPFKNIPEIIRVLEQVNDDVEVLFNKNQIAISYEGLYLTSRVIDGVFPDYKQIIPKEFKTEAVVLKQDLINSLKLATIFSDNLNQISVGVHPSKKTLELQTKNADVGENKNKLEAALSGEDIDINFNYKYILDCFQSIDSDSISLQFNAINRPVVIRGVSDKSFMYLVMPMNK